MIEYIVSLTAEEIEALDDLSYYGGDHILCSWDSGDPTPLMGAVWSAVDKMRKVFFRVIEINETEPVEASLTIVLRGLYVTDFKDMISSARYEPGSEFRIAEEIWQEINS